MHISAQSIENKRVACPQPPEPPPPARKGCAALGLGGGWMTCADAGLLAAFVCALPLLALLVRARAAAERGEPAGSWRQLLGLAAAAERGGRGDEWAAEPLLPRGGGPGAPDQDGGPLPKTLGSGLEYPPLEARLRAWYLRQVAALCLCCARRAGVTHDTLNPDTLAEQYWVQNSHTLPSQGCSVQGPPHQAQRAEATLLKPLAAVLPRPSLDSNIEDS